MIKLGKISGHKWSTGREHDPSGREPNKFTKTREDQTLAGTGSDQFDRGRNRSETF